MSDEEKDVRTRLVPLDGLLLDPNNPRLIEDPEWRPVLDEEIGRPSVQADARRRLLAIAFDPISALMESIARSGWVEAEPILVRVSTSGDAVVVDGNRRVVALRELEDSIRVGTVFVREVDIGSQDTQVARVVKHTETRVAWTDLARAAWQRELRRSHPEWSRIDVKPVGRGWLLVAEADEDLVLDVCADYLASPWRDNFDPVGTFSLFQAALRNESIGRWLGYGTEGGPTTQNVARFFAWLNDDRVPDHDRGAGRIVRTEFDMRRLGYLLSHVHFVASIERVGSLTPAWYRGSPGQQRPPTPLASDLPWPVSSVGPWSGLASLTVRQYRGLSEVGLHGLTRINVLVGANNTGKTSLLESILLLCHLCDPRGQLEAIRARVRGNPERLPRAGLARVMPDGASISTVLRSGNHVQVEHFRAGEPNDVESNLATLVASLRIESSLAGERQVSLTDFHTDRPRFTQMVEGTRAWLATVVFHSPFSLADRKLLSSCYAQSVKAGTKDELVGFIRQHVDDEVKDIELVDSDGRFLVQRPTNAALDLSSYGEGMQRIFQIGLLFAAHAHGVVLIDEFENALHTTVITAFSRLIQELAVRFDVQVFLTTHSDEAVKAFLLNDYRTEDVTTFRLKRDGGRVLVRRFEGKSHRLAVEAAGTDVRRL